MYRSEAPCQGSEKNCKDRVARMLALFDNRDARLPYYELMLEGRPECDPAVLPPGYSIETYAPGDEDAWIDIEISAREFGSRKDGEDAWQRYYAGHEKELTGRMFFVVDAAKRKVATATAFYDIRTGDNGVDGWLHWVAVRRDEQGHGLSKPIITQAVKRMKEMGYSRIVIPTQTTTWLACKVYLDLGFRPIAKNAERNAKGWEIIKTLTMHPALDAFKTISEAEIGSYLSKDDLR